MRRRATPDDLEAIHAIYTDDSVSPYLSYDPMPLEAFCPIFARLLETGNLYVFEVNGAVMGFWGHARSDGRTRHVAHLGPLAVAPAAQGSGVGRAMIEDALLLLETEGVTRVELLAEADNMRGLRFYEKMGFEVEGVQRKAYQRGGDAEPVDEVMMVRFLD